MIKLEEVYDPRIRVVLEIVKRDSLISIDALAAEVCLSTSGLQHFFQREVGISLGKYLAQSRLAIAGELLRSGVGCTKQIASEVGYRHVSSFNRAFRKAFGLTPGKFARRRKAEDGAQKVAMSIVE